MKKLQFITVIAVLLVVYIYPLSADSQTVFTRDAIITGGGIVVEGKGKDALKITFGVDLLINYFVNEAGEFVDGEGNSTVNGELVFAEPPEGSLHVSFHNTGNNADIDRGKFTITEITWMRLSPRSYPDSEGEPNFIFVSMTGKGKFNGEDGWTINFRFSDFGNPGNSKATKSNLADAVRIGILNPDGINVYDTADINNGFPHEQAWRTLLDGGNITIYYQR